MTYPPSGTDDQTYPQQRSYTTEPPAGSQPYSGAPHSAQPYSAEPYSGQPYSGQPYDQGYAPPAQYSAPPHYSAPHSAPPHSAPPAGYQQPVYGPPPSFMPPAAAPAPPSGGGRTGGMVALVVGSVVLLLVLVGVGLALFLRSDDEPPTPAAPTAQASAATEAEYPARIELPQTLAGMSKIDDEDLNALANEIANDLKTSTEAETAYVAYYAPAGEATKIVGVIGATGKMERPGTELDDMFSEMEVTGIEAVDPGPMGGHMKCGIQESPTQRLTICGWADAGSLGLGIFLDRPMGESEILFRQIRGEVLKRG